MKVVTVLGARPQFIKASVVSHRFAQADGVSEVVVHTGQHFDSNMSDVFFEELGMAPPAYHLNIHGGTHGEMTGRMLIELEKVLIAERPDVVLVYGDTNSTLAGALAAVKLHIPVAHVEAGLRSFNMAMPEEVNRILTDRISKWLFTPTGLAAANLQREGFISSNIIAVGDVMYDVALHHGARVGSDGGILGSLNVAPRDYILATVHRAENTDSLSRLTAIFEAFCDLAHTTNVIWPIHPRTRAILDKSRLLDEIPGGLKIIEPVGYLDMVQLEKYALVIATDSGGVQKEAFFYGVPCVTLRDETEWVELVESGWNRLVSPTGAKSVVDAIKSSLGTIGAPIQPYGSGHAAAEIVKYLQKAFAK